MAENNNITTWPQLAEGLYRFLTDHKATIEYSFENMRIGVPRDSSDGAPQAQWRVDGTIRVRTFETA